MQRGVGTETTPSDRDAKTRRKRCRETAEIEKRGEAQSDRAAEGCRYAEIWRKV